MERKNVSSSTPWEEKYAYSRAVRKGSMVFVAGTVAATAAGDPIGATSYEQTKAIFAKIERALSEVGASMSDVVRTRAFVVDINQHNDGIGRAHYEAFAGTEPVMSMIGIAELIGEGFIVEIEVDAVVG